jgi:hypothetical protein
VEARSGRKLMGMDVFGKEPTTEEGEYFRNTVTFWRPLADYVQEVAPEVRGRVPWKRSRGMKTTGELKAYAALPRYSTRVDRQQSATCALQA